MKVLSVNAGSSTLKFQLFEMPEESVLIQGSFERIGEVGSFYTIRINGEKIKKEVDLKNHGVAFEILVNELIENNIVNSLEDIKAVGHRVVQGGSYFDKSVVITDDVIGKIDELKSLAPLHNPAAITGIKAAIEVFKDAVQVAVFDTAFHQTMPKYNYLYPVPYSWYEDYSVRKYGAHGTSHKYVSERLNNILGKTNTKLIICHIGSGCSITAVENGKCINTSMGLTPNAGLMMGTRCGDIDASIIPYISKKANMSLDMIDHVLNKESGLLAISTHNDSRDIEDGINNGEERCILAQKMFVRKVVDYIAKYYVELNGVDAIAFTAGIGENSIMTRKDIMEELKVLSVVMDEDKNNTRGKEVLITKPESKIACYVIPTNEELMIAKDTYNLV